MAGFMEISVDTVVVGAGAAGIGAAIGAAKNGDDILLIEAGPLLGGELLAGMTINGAVNARGEPIVGGVMTELLDECAKMDGYLGVLNDHRLIRYHAYDPEVMKVAITRVLERHRAKLLMYSFVEDVVVDRGHLTGLVVVNKTGRLLVRARNIVDCSGDADVVAKAGSPTELSDDSGDLQPVSIMFRICNVEPEPLLRFVRSHPDYVAVGESDVIRAGRTDQELVDSLYEQGEPCVFFKGQGPFLRSAIERGEMYPTALIMIEPTSRARREVTVNSTRVWDLNALDIGRLSMSMSSLYDQVWTCARFLKVRVPGFESSALSAIAPRMGIRETRRIVGAYRLTEADVMSGRRFDDVIGKGCHHIDIHGRGLEQVRIPVANGGSYDIPFRCLVPVGLSNVLAAGRCVSSDRAAHGTARNMGNCLAMGEAAGTAAALRSQQNRDTAFASLPMAPLQARLKQNGAILDGVH
jgi:hypothetical protein